MLTKKMSDKLPDPAVIICFLRRLSPAFFHLTQYKKTIVTAKIYVTTKKC